MGAVDETDSRVSRIQRLGVLLQHGVVFFTKALRCGLIAFAFNVGLALVVFSVPDEYEPKGVTLSVVLAVATYVMVHIPFALYANRLLFNRARAEIKRVDALELSDADRDIAIRKRGGKNFPAMWLALVLCTVMFVLFR